MNNIDEKKLTDKAFSHAIISSLIAIFICLICLCSSTWAWFTDSVEFGGGTLKAGECLLEIKVQDELGTEIEDIDSGVALNAGIYTVTLTLPKDSTSGYCIIETETTSYYSDYILHHDNDTPMVVTFYVDVKSSQTVKFVERWGVYSGDIDVEDNGTLTLPAVVDNE